MANLEAYGNRVVGSGSSGGGGGLTKEEHDALMSIASMPARGDINPAKTDDYKQVYSYAFAICDLPVIGYAKLAMRYTYNTGGISASFRDRDNNVISSISLSTSWQYFDIPENAYTFRGQLSTSSAANQANTSYALFTKDSPYNPDNQTP